MTYPRALRSLFPAETGRLDYPFFRNAAIHPFDFTRFDERLWTNAWWCSQLSLLAYHEDQSAISPALAQGGLTLGSEVVEVGGLRAFVAHAGETAFVVFRGTVLPLPTFPFLPGPFLDQVRNWATNLNGIPDTPRNGGPGKVHGGFQDALAKLRTKGLDAVQLTHGKTNVVWTGHSLGAGLALLSPRFFNLGGDTRQTIMSFGGPRTADDTYLAALGVAHGRFVHGSDIFAADPPNALIAPFVSIYSHHGPALPVVTAEDDGWPTPSDTALLDLIDTQIALTPTDKWSAALVLSFIGASIRDHAPMLYAAACEGRMKAG